MFSKGTRALFRYKAFIAITLGVVTHGASIARARECLFVANVGLGISEVVAIDAAAMRIAATYEIGEEATGLVIDPEHGLLYVSHAIESGEVSIVSALTGKILRTVAVGPFPSAVAIAPDHQRLYVLNADQTVSIVNTTTHAIATVPVPQRSRGLLQGFAFTSTGGLFVASCPPGICVVDGSSGQIVNRIEVSILTDSDVMALATHGNTLFAAVRSGETVPDIIPGAVAVVPFSENRVVDSINTLELPSAIAVSPDGTRLYATLPCHRNPHCTDGQVAIFDTATHDRLDTLFVPSEPYFLVLTTDGRTAWVSDPDAGVYAIDTTAKIAGPALAIPFARGMTIGSLVECAEGQPTPTPTETTTPHCPGDCNMDGEVSIDELMHGVLVALGGDAMGDCGLDVDGDGLVMVNELIAGVGAALGDCA